MTAPELDGELLLAGGGDSDDSRPLDEHLVELVGTDAAMGYVPVAMPPERYPDCREWIADVFEPLGLTDVRTWTDLSRVGADDLAAVDAVYLGGGNTYRLLAALRRTGLDDRVRAFVADGGVLYGGSAGAIVCGDRVETTPDEAVAGLGGAAGLGLLPGVDVWCHYDGDPGPVREYAARTGRTVVAIPERSGAAVAADGGSATADEESATADGGSALTLRTVGHVPLSVVRPGDPAGRSGDGPTTVPPGERIRLGDREGDR